MPLILGTNSIKDTGFDVANSLRFDDGGSEYLERTPSSTGNRKTWTFSTWIKRSGIGLSAPMNVFGGEDGASRYTDIMIGTPSGADDTFWFKQDTGTVAELRSTLKLRDPSAWYHLLFVYDSTNGTADDRMKMYVNGVQLTSFVTRTNVGSNVDSYVNTSGDDNYVGVYDGSSKWLDGYLCETALIDGTALTPTSFGEFDEDSGIWKPKDFKNDVTFGTNGFYLEYKETGTSQNSSGIGADTSGNNHHFAVNNLTAIDQMTDTPTLNYAVMNNLDNYYAGSTFSEGNLKIVTVASGSAYMVGTIGISSGKWYWEVKAVSFTTGADYCAIGVSSTQITGTSQLGANSNDYGFGNTGTQNSGGSSSSYGSSYGNNDIIGVYLDLDNNKLYFSINGTLQNSGTGISITAAASTSLGAYFPAISDWSSSGSNLVTAEFNFGGGCPFSITSGNTDGEYGNFEYSTTITGDGSSKTFKALNTKNLAEYG